MLITEDSGPKKRTKSSWKGTEMQSGASGFKNNEQKSLVAQCYRSNLRRRTALHIYFPHTKPEIQPRAAPFRKGLATPVDLRPLPSLEQLRIIFPPKSLYDTLSRRTASAELGIGTARSTREHWRTVWKGKELLSNRWCQEQMKRRIKAFLNSAAKVMPHLSLCANNLSPNPKYFSLCFDICYCRLRHRTGSPVRLDLSAFFDGGSTSSGAACFFHPRSISGYWPRYPGERRPFSRSLFLSFLLLPSP